MTIRIPHLIIAAMVVAISASRACMAASTMLFSNQAYLSSAHSPLQGPSSGSLIIENFENATVNSLITAIGGAVKGPSANTHSVDADDGSMDGSGAAGHSFSTTGKKMTFKFATQGGAKPTMAGLAWTHGKPNSTVTFRAWDADGNLIGKIRKKLGNTAQHGTASAARFFGVMDSQGIARMTISSNRKGFEVDHVQFAYGFSVVPVPPALMLGAAGLAGVAFCRKRLLRTLGK